MLKKIVSAKLAGNIVLTILMLMLLLHLLILTQVIPPSFVWGGRLEAFSGEVLSLEMISLLVTLMFLIFIAAKVGYILNKKYNFITNIGVWIMFIYFTLNVFMNLASNSTTEKIIFTPITIILALLTFRLAIEK